MSVSRLVSSLLRAVGPACILAVLTPQSSLAQRPDVQALGSIVDSIARARIAAGEAPAFGIAVGYRNEVILERGYGTADVESNTAAGPHTLFAVASVSKQFTAAAILQLVEKGEIRLDVPITTYLPDYPAAGSAITVRQLLNHTSGIPDFINANREDWARVSRLDLSYEEMLELFADEPLSFAPGSRYSYSNSGYYLLGEIVERVTGRELGRQIEEALLIPLGLTDIVHCDDQRIIPGRAEGYGYRDGSLVNAAYTSVSRVSPGTGGLCATAGALVRWTQLLHGGEVLSPASLQLMTSPTITTEGDTVPYGLGLRMVTLETIHGIGHSGSRPGFSAFLVHYPEQQLTTVVLGNTSEMSAGSAEQAIARRILGIPLTDLPLELSDITQLDGVYTLQVGDQLRDMRVFGQDGALMARIEGQSIMRLMHQGARVFVSDLNENYRIEFSGNDIAQSLVFRIGTREIHGTRRTP